MSIIDSTSEINGVRLKEQGGDPASPAGTYELLYSKAGGIYVKNSGGSVTGPFGSASGDITYAQVQAAQLVNEFKGWPPVVSTGDLDALNLWWDKIGTPTTAPSVVAGNDGGITLNYNLVLKTVADAGSEGLSQTWTYADEPRIKSGRVMSVLLAIWSVGSISITAKLVNSDASHTDAGAVTAAAWTLVEIPNHTLAGTSVSLQVTAGAAGTFYVVPLGANIGSRAFPLGPRPVRHVDGLTATVLNGVDPGGAGYAALSFQASSSKLAHLLQIGVIYNNATTQNVQIRVRRKGDTGDSLANEVVRNAATGAGYYVGSRWLACDDSQNIEWKSTGAAGDNEALYINLIGYQEWG